jgi:putative transposase
MGRKSKFSDAEILGAVHEIEGGARPTDVSRRLGVSTQTLQRWRAKYSGMSVPEVQEKRRLEEENRKLRGGAWCKPGAGHADIYTEDFKGICAYANVECRRRLAHKIVTDSGWATNQPA